jgi:microcin C transport system permease protein
VQVPDRSSGGSALMGAYIIRRLLLMIPTLFGIMLVVFTVVQFTPGGPVEQQIARMQGIAISPTERITGGGDELGGGGNQAATTNNDDQTIRNRDRGAEGLTAEYLRRLEIQFGFDKPPVERFFTMLWNYIRFDFGESYFRQISVVDLIIEKMPVSISLGLWMTLLSYAISIPLGIRKAVKDGTPFDRWTSLVVIIGYSVPGFLFAIALIILLAGGSYLDIFPLRFLTSSGWDSFPWYEKILDYFWHLILPVICLAIGAFATTTIFVKNVFLDEIRKPGTA